MSKGSCRVVLSHVETELLIAAYVAIVEASQRFQVAVPWAADLLSSLAALLRQIPSESHAHDPRDDVTFVFILTEEQCSVIAQSAEVGAYWHPNPIFKEKYEIIRRKLNPIDLAEVSSSAH